MEAHIHKIGIPRPKNQDIEIPRLKNHGIKIPRPKNHDIEIRGLKHREKRRQISHNIVIPRRFFRGQKATTSRFQDQKTTTSRFQDQKATTLSSCGILTMMPPDRNPTLSHDNARKSSTDNRTFVYQ